jgi:hypothetical protein
VLFQLVNLIGEYATDFGYRSTTLFEEPKESLALNFFIRALAPTVYIVALSAVAVATGYESFRIGVYWVVIFYYLFRAIYIVIFNLQRLVSWPRFILHSSFGLIAAWLAYKILILPNRSLLPNLDELGNEMWLAIFAFLYAAANKVQTSGGPGDRRRNAFVTNNYVQAERLYGGIINEKTSDEMLRLITYSILIFENYSRPPVVRLLERFCFWKRVRTTGIMQVSSADYLNNSDSVRLGAERLAKSWQDYGNEDAWQRIRSTISDYNKDDVYISKVAEVMRILAYRAAPKFKIEYEAAYGSFE